ncbi:MAG TPA: hypothetical protein VKG91_09190 [Roseiarcus sp.]|nr:hypothetical protein [Roseiarcus sp.]
MIGSIIKEILGLFVDDEILAIGILAIVGLAAAITLMQRGGPTVAALVLVIGLPAILVADVLLTLRRSTRT